MNVEVDYLVIGGGAMGSATAYSLAAAGHEVLLLERFGAGHSEGASHGTTRNFNPAYVEPPYIELLRRSHELWDEISVASGTKLLTRTGLVNHGIVNEQREMHRFLKAAGFASELLSARDAKARFGGMEFETETLFIPAGGQINADLSVESLQKLATSFGATIEHEQTVLSLEVIDSQRVHVRSRSTQGDRQIIARHVILTVGAWTHQLLNGQLELPRIHVTEEHPVHFPKFNSADTWPGFNHILSSSRSSSKIFGPIYGMHTPGEGIKIGWHGAGKVVDPDQRPHEVDPEHIEALQNYASQWLPGVNTERYQSVSCTYANTEDENFILDRFGPITVGAGFSGHGFKFVPAIGEHLAQLATGTQKVNLFFAATRNIARPVFLERRQELGIS